MPFTNKRSAEVGEKGSQPTRSDWPAIRMDYRVSEKVDGVQVPQLVPAVAATVAVVAVVVIE